MSLTPEQIQAARTRIGMAPIADPSVLNRSNNLKAAWASSENVNNSGESGYKPTFQATGDETPINAALKTAGNLPSSTLNFGKGVIDFLNPLNTYKKAQELGTALGDTEATKVSATDVVKEIPGTLYKGLVPKFLQHIFSGNIKSAAAAIENDPVGEIAPLILIARGAAEKLGKGAEFDSAMTKVSSVVTTPVKVAIKGATDVVSQSLGATTGSGSSSIKEAFNAASEGPDVLKATTDAMRGNIEPTDIVKSAEDVVQRIKTERGKQYVNDLAKIGEDTKTHDITPVTNELDTQLKNFGLTDKEGNIKVNQDGKLDFSRSSIANNASARADIQGVYDTLKDWGTQTGDRTGVGLDLLKKQLSDFYSESSQARAFVQAMKGKVTDLLVSEVPGYQEMTSKYAKASNFLDEIKSATGAGSNAKPDTIFTKLTTAMKGDKEFRLEILKQMEAVDPNLMNKIAGINLSTWMPRGLVGKAADAGSAVGILLGHFNPQIIPFLLSTSPRIIGEFVRGLGIAKNASSNIVSSLNTLKALNFDVTGFIKDNLPKNKSGGFIENPIAPKIGSIENLMEDAGGWKPGMRQVFDTALLHNDAPLVQSLLPHVPQEYKLKFADKINQILGK